MGADDVLLERDEVLTHLAQLVVAAASGRGQVVVISGEAGIGKSALLVRLLDELPLDVRVWTGSCERLFAPRPLGPLVDMVGDLPTTIGAAVRRGAAVHELLPLLLEELRAAPSVVAIEDLHWADEATSDLVALLGRRLAATKGLLIVTCRDDALELDHPLRAVLAGLAAAGGERIRLERLSRGAVRMLATSRAIDVDELFRMTGGNPFFVTEVLAAGGAVLPVSVRDAVVARAGTLDPAARSLLEALSVSTGPAPPELVAQLGGAAATRLGACLASGMLVDTPSGVAFRHDLARVAIAESVDPLRRIALNRVALGLLRATNADVARLAHHADEARHAEALETFAPRAAFDAVERGAHREAVAQFRRALRPQRRIVGVGRAELLEHGAHELYLTDHFDDAIAWLDDAIAIRHAAGDVLGEADDWRRLSGIQRCGGRAADAAVSGAHALVLLEAEPEPASASLAAAHANVAMLALNTSDIDAGLAAVDRAMVHLDEQPDRDVLVHALNTRGFLRVLDGDEAGLADLEESLAVSLAEGRDEHVGRAYIHLADIAQRHRRWDLIDGRAEDADRYCAEHGLDLWHRYLRMYLARTALDRGRWSEALASIPPYVVEAGTPLARIGPLVITGLIRARRGDPDPWSPLDEAADRARHSGELQWVAPVTAARLEAGWLDGTGGERSEDSSLVLRDCEQRRAGWWAGEIAWWRRCCGLSDSLPGQVPAPWALLLAGRGREAAAAWHEIGCPYEEGVSLASTNDPDDLRDAFERFDCLGARPAATLTAKRMRSLGVAVPRGVRRSTRDNPAGLTAREMDVLRLISQGLHNREIAADLVVSPKTVEHHVSAVLRKLGVNDRQSATRLAGTIGIDDHGRSPGRASPRHGPAPPVATRDEHRR